MKPAGTHRSVAAFALALGLLSAVAVIDWRQTRRVEETAMLVSRTHEVQANLNRLLSLVQDIETGARGFVVTGDPTFLEPYEAALNAVKEQQSKLAQLILSDEQKTNLRVLESLIVQRIALSRRNVELRRDEGFEAARQAVASRQGRVAMDAVRAQLARMDATEQRLLDERSTAARLETRNAVLLSVGVITLSAVLFIGIYAFILRENRMRQQMQLQLDRFFTLSLDMLCIANMDGYFKRLSPAFTQTLGYTTDELMARPFLEFVHPDDRAATLAEVEKLGRGVPTISFENRYACRDGSWRWLSWKAQPVAEEGQLYATARDITERKQAEREISQLNAELKDRADQLVEANKELESFSYSVSHDLRAPLRHVQGYVEMLQRATDGQLSQQGQRYLKTIREASVEMGQLIDDLLAFSRMGRSEMRETVVPLNSLVQATIDGLETATAGRNIAWRIPPLPPVVGDPALLKQVLANLVGNAVKYSRERHRAEIEIGCAGEEDGRIIMFVRDNGAGFDMKYANKLFGVFQRLHRPEEFEGTGIGLATVRRIVARHGGRVWAESAINEGAAFYFTLKRSPPA